MKKLNNLKNIKNIKKPQVSYIDSFGIKSYKIYFKILIGFIILYSYIFLAAIPLYFYESVADGTKINSYRDAVWLLQMAASTIGFGDVYPVTEIGRFIIAVSFYVGVGLAGYIGATISSYFMAFTDNSVQNAELRKQNAEILENLKLLKESMGIN